jgi:hypothetical protein
MIDFKNIEKERVLDNLIQSKLDEIAYDEAGVPTSEEILEQLTTGKSPHQIRQDPIYSTLFTCGDGLVGANSVETPKERAVYNKMKVPQAHEILKRLEVRK